MRCNKSQNTCDTSCPGWGWFNNAEVQRCDECDAYANDAEARAHIEACDACQRLLAAEIRAEGGVCPLCRCVPCVCEKG